MISQRNILDAAPMTVPVDLTSMWVRLEVASPHDGNLLVMELEHPSLPPRAVLLSHTDERLRGVLLQVRSPTTPLPKLRAGGLAIERESRVNEAGELEHFIRVDCASAELHDVFDKLIERVVQRLAQGATAVDACNDAVREFRRLLARIRGDLPSEEVILGLIGELHFLLKLVELDQMHWHSWIGVTGSNVDFSFAGVDIECKTGRSSDAPRITVHGLDQLEPMGGQQLYLRHLSIEPNPSGALHVPGLVDRILQHVVDQEGFMALLAQTPYDMGQRELWCEEAYTPVVETVYRVNDVFPRIRPSMFEGGQLPPAISSLRYDVSLQHAASCRLADAEVRSLISSLVTEVHQS